MSIMEIANIKNANSKKYRDIISNIYTQYKTLYKIMELYSVADSLIYISLAYKCFEKIVAEDINRSS